MRSSCTWPDKDCEKILNGFYSFYHDYVIGQTTNVSVTRTKMLTFLLKNYSERHHQLDMAVRNYQINVMARKQMQNFEQANAEFMAAKKNAERLQQLIQSVSGERNVIIAKLSTTPATIESHTMSGPGQAPERLSAVEARDAAKKDVQDLLVKYTPNAPQVKAAQVKS